MILIVKYKKHTFLWYIKQCQYNLIAFLEGFPWKWIFLSFIKCKFTTSSTYYVHSAVDLFSFLKKVFLDPLYSIYSPGNSQMAQECTVKEPCSVNLRTSILHMMQAFSAVIRQFRCVMTDLSLLSGWTQLILLISLCSMKKLHSRLLVVSLIH